VEVTFFNNMEKAFEIISAYLKVSFVGNYEELDNKSLFNPKVLAQLSQMWSLSISFCCWESVHLEDEGLDLRIILNRSYGK
jgi:hypothetical protein